MLVLTMLDDEASVLAAMKVGARGYLLKDARTRRWRAIARGGGDGLLAALASRFGLRQSLSSSWRTHGGKRFR